MGGCGRLSKSPHDELLSGRFSVGKSSPFVLGLGPLIEFTRDSETVRDSAAKLDRARGSGNGIELNGGAGKGTFGGVDPLDVAGSDVTEFVWRILGAAPIDKISAKFLASDACGLYLRGAAPAVRTSANCAKLVEDEDLKVEREISSAVYRLAFFDFDSFPTSNDAMSLVIRVDRVLELLFNENRLVLTSSPSSPSSPKFM